MKKNKLSYLRCKVNLQNEKFSLLQNKGQVVLEYLLLMVVVVSVAAVLTQALVKRSTDEASQGMIVKSWNKMLGIIGNDLADCSRQDKFQSPKCK